MSFVDQSVDSLKGFWKSPLHGVVVARNLKIEHCLEIFSLQFTTWVDSIAECLPILVEKPLLVSLLNEVANQSNPKLSDGEFDNLLPIQEFEELLTKNKNSAAVNLPLPEDEPDVDGHVWVKENLLWLDSQTVLQFYVKLRRDEPKIIHDSFRQAILSYIRSDPPELFRHSPDYLSIRFRGKAFSLTSQQAQVIELLHERFKQGIPWLGKERIFIDLRKEFYSGKLKDIFRSRKEAWKALVVSDKKGRYKLNVE